MAFASRISSQFSSTARSTTPVSVEKYGWPVPPAQKMTVPFSIARMALSLLNSSAMSPIWIEDITFVFIPCIRKISET